MKKGGVLLSLVTVTMILFTTFLSIEASAGEAGVGVLNVPPKYSMIRVVQQDKFIRVYLTISDYNSWEDIFTVWKYLNFFLNNMKIQFIMRR